MTIPLIDFVAQMYRLESIIIILTKLYCVTINRAQCHAYIHFLGPKRTNLLRQVVSLLTFILLFVKAKV